VKPLASEVPNMNPNRPQTRPVSANVKPKQRKQPIRYLTTDEWRRLLDAIDRFEHKLLFRVCFELGCRVGELVRIQAKHIDFHASTVFIPAENTKTKTARTSHLPRELLNDVRHVLARRHVLSKRDSRLRKPDAYLFASPDRRRRGQPITENRVRQVFRRYADKAGLAREYGVDSQGRKLWRFSVHSLRHTHCMHYIHVAKLPIPVVQRQVGHRTLDATMVYCQPTDEMVGEAYEEARRSALADSVRRRP